MKNQHANHPILCIESKEKKVMRSCFHEASPFLFTLTFLYKDKKLQHHKKFRGTLFIKEHSKNNSAS
jgi:hypothetical protein